jgi:hypothetical protein
MKHSVYRFFEENLDILVRTEVALSLETHLKAKGLTVDMVPAAVRDNRKKATHDLLIIGGEATVNSVKDALADFNPTPLSSWNYPTRTIIRQR